MNAFLIQIDQCDSVIQKIKVDLDDVENLIDKVLYFDTCIKSNRRVISDWIKKRDYLVGDLSISGDSFDDGDDGFYVESMYLSIEII